MRNIVKKKRILFIIPPITEKIWSNHYHEIYLGLAYIANIASKKNYLLKVIDCDACFIPLNSIKKKILLFKPDIICLTSLYGSLNNAFKIIKIAKQNSLAKIILGGLPATFISNEILNSHKEIDILVRGESELTFIEILNGISLDQIGGISYRLGDKIIHNKGRNYINNLDLLGIPKRNIFPLKKYKIRFKTYNSTAIETSRGCPYACDFCTQKPKEGRKLRLRSPKIVMKELNSILKFTSIKRIMIIDNDFLTNKDHANEILNLIIKNGFNRKFHFMFATRVDNIMIGGDKLLKLIKKANVNTIFFGIESVSDKYKKSIGKIKNEKKIIELFNKLESYEIDPMPSYVIGYPNETKNDINQTLNLAKKLNTKILSFNILTPYPGTLMYDFCVKKNLLLHSNYNSYDNAHAIIKHKLNLNKEFLRMHREYFFRLEYFKKINLLKLFDRRNGGRLAMFLYYLFFMEVQTIFRGIKRILKKIIYKNNCFET
jgi:anaerobic magnesium-protoporphyrin IX monomethyl ester cyclase